MAELKITKARLELLRSVRDGVVWYSVGSGHGQFTIRREGETWRTVTGQAYELRVAGWIESAPPGASYFSSRAVRLTAAGESLLAVDSLSPKEPTP